MPKHKNNDAKVWDTPDIDKWAIEPWKPEDNKGGPLLETSEFSILFPKYREVYLKEAWPMITNSLKQHGVACQLDLVEGSMKVATTRKTSDPSIILKARDLIRLLARSVPAPKAIEIMKDGMACDIIKLRSLVRNKEKFVKRILGQGGRTLKALELLTSTYILVHGNTVSVMGGFKSLKEVRRVVEDCMNNIHPIYHIKELMVKQELAKDPELAEESWDRFLPNYKKRSLSKRRVPFKVADKSKKPYTPFPPAQEPSKVDLQIEAGEYHLGREAKKRIAEEERLEKQKAKKEERKREREQEFVAPEEGTERKKKKRVKVEAEE